MKIRLLDVDSKIPNLALMKISAWHKNKKHDVSFYNPLFDGEDIDIVYASKIFNFTADYGYTPQNTTKGGYAYNNNILPNEIEHIMPDYSLYKCNYAMGFTSRGCNRKCSFCIVPKKEGKFNIVSDIYEFWKDHKHIMLLDNNLTFNEEHFIKILNQLIIEQVKVDFNQGLDIRLITPKMSQLLSKVKLWKQIHFAFDDIKYEKAIYKGIEILKNNGVKLYKLMFYVLIGYNSTEEEDIYRVETLRGLDVDPFVMPYNKYDIYQRRFARWVNHKAIFKSVKWEKYK